jgi:hypothetical protein
MSAFPHYFKALPAGCTHIDVYRVLALFEVSDPALQHAIKKLLCAGARGAKDQAQDIAEAIATLQRWQQMRAEELPLKRCECRAKLIGDCPGQWEPGCDLGANEAHVVPAQSSASEPSERIQGCFSVSGHDNRPRPRPRPVHAREISELKPPTSAPEKINIHGFDFPPQNFNIACETCGRKRCPHAHDSRMQCTGVRIKEQTPAAEPTLRDEVERIRAVFAELPREHLDAAMDRLRAEREEEPEEKPAAAPEDAERAAYLARWKGAPEWAEWLSQDFDGRCDFWEVEPSLFSEAEWVSSDGEPTHTDRKTAENLLGSVRCEPRPTPEGGQGVGP